MTHTACIPANIQLALSAIHSLTGSTDILIAIRKRPAQMSCIRVTGAFHLFEQAFEVPIPMTIAAPRKMEVVMAQFVTNSSQKFRKTRRLHVMRIKLQIVRRK